MLNGGALTPVELETTIILVLAFLALRNATRLQGDAEDANSETCCVINQKTV
jgi:hypothetical protein